MGHILRRSSTLKAGLILSLWATAAFPQTPSPNLAPGAMIAAAARLVRSTTDQQAVFLVDGAGKRRLFSSSQLFLGSGLKFEQIQTLAPAQVNSIPLGTPLATPADVTQALASLGGKMAPIPTPVAQAPGGNQVQAPPAVGQLPGAELPAAVNPDLLEALSLLPLDEFNGYAERLKRKLRQYSPNGFAAKEGPFVLNVLLDGTSQAMVLAVEGTTRIPDSIMDETLSEQLAGSEFRDPLFVISLKNGVMPTRDMAPELQAVIKRSYFGLPGIDLRQGLQVVSRAGIKGLYGSLLADVMGVPAEDFILSAGRLMRLQSIPSEAIGGESNSDSTSSGDLARLFAKQMKNKADKKAAKKAGKAVPKEPPDYFVQLQMAPGTTVKGPLGMSQVMLRDATFFASSLGTFGYKGNVDFAALPKKPFLGFFEVPYNAAGAVKLTDIKFGLASPSLNLAELALVAQSFATPKAPGGNFLPKVELAQKALQTMEKPLSVFELVNPNPIPEYRFGDPSHPFPPASAFNIMLLGPFARETLGKLVVKGPYLKAVGNARVLGQTMGRSDISFSEHGLRGEASGGVAVNLGSVGLGTPSVRMAASVHIDEHQQSLGLAGPLQVPDPTRQLSFALGRDGIQIVSNATCLTPIDVNASVAYGGFNPGNLPLNAVTPDFKKLASCGGDTLLQGGKWLGEQTFKGAKEAYAAGQQAGRFAAKGAVEVGKVATAAAEATEKATVQAAQAAGAAAQAAANAAGAAARDAANRAADAARNAANQAIGQARSVAYAVGSAFGGGGTKTCNQRIGWLRERGNVPTPQSIDAFVEQVFVPLIGAAPKAAAYMAHAGEVHADWERATTAFTALGERWNQRVRQKKLPGASIEVAAYRSYAPAASPAADAGRRLGAMRQQMDMLAAANRKHFNEWVGFRPFVDGWDNGHRPESQALWQRCASVYTANIPTNMAVAWKTYVPRMPPKISLDAMFYSSQDYARVKQGVADRVHALHHDLDQQLNVVTGFSGDWVNRSGNFVRDIRVRAESLVLPQTRTAMADTAASGKIAGPLKEWYDAVAALEDTMKNALMHARGANGASLIPSAQQAASAVDRVVDAADKLNAAAG